MDTHSLRNIDNKFDIRIIIIIRATGYLFLNQLLLTDHRIARFSSSERTIIPQHIDQPYGYSPHWPVNLLV